MDDRVAAAHRGFHSGWIANVAFNELVPGIGGHGLEIRQVACVRQLIEIDNRIISSRSENVSDEIRADEPRASGDEDLHRGISWLAAIAALAGSVSLLAPVFATR